MTLEIPYKSEEERIEYYSWITRTGISCSWNYYNFKNKQYMIIEIEDEDATAFKLKFGI
jgi:hypothetical protein